MSDIKAKFNSYYNLVTRHLERPICKVKSDKSGEYVNHELRDRTLEEKARTLLIELNLNKDL